jgi:alkyldihydroxyacetonephosphate synthase
VRREQVFWGWGEPGAGPELPHGAAKLLRDELGVGGEVVSRPVALEDVRLRPPALPAAARERLVAAVGAGHVRDDQAARVLRCRGKSYLDLLAQRAGDCEAAPDAVVAPADAERVAAVLAACAETGVAVVPFGGGTSVVGGLEPLRGGFESVISLDLGRLDGLLGADPRSLIATFGAGTRLPEADRALRARGLALAHVPQSFEWASVGGCAATRSAGQLSSGHGRIDDQVLALDCVTPAGPLATLEVPASAAGPSLRQLLMGSEGALGVLTRVALRVRRAPAAVRYEGWALPGFEAGCEALRALAQDGVAPDVARLSDEEETRGTLILAGTGRAGRALLGGRALLVCGWEGEAIARRRGPVAARLLRHGGRPLGRRPGEAWRAARFAGPYLRDDLLDRGVMVETLETATTWTNLQRLHAAVTAALPAAHIGCHVSHLYETGASLYFTVMAAQDAADPAGQWRAAKTAATQAILSAGGTLTHHHAIGRDHAEWLAAEIGQPGIDTLWALKLRCDPHGLMNPGKVVLGCPGSSPKRRVS